jgi:hypothetical protein
VLDRILCGGFGLLAISFDDDAGIDMASVVSFENPPAPDHPAAKGVFSETISEVVVGKFHGPSMPRPPDDYQEGQLLPPLERRSEGHGYALPDADICFANDKWANTEDPKKERIILALP